MVFVFVEDMLYKKKLFTINGRYLLLEAKSKVHVTGTSAFAVAYIHKKTRLSIINNGEISCRHTIRKVLSPAQASGRMLSQYVTGSSVCRAV